MGDQTKQPPKDSKEVKEPEALREIKNQWAKCEAPLKTDPEPVGALQSLEEWLASISSEDETFEFFVDTILTKAVRTLILRNDLRSAIVPRVGRLFIKIVEYCVRFLPEDYQFAVITLDTLFSPDKKNTFYKTYGHHQHHQVDDDLDLENCNDEWAVSNYMLACINVFINLNGHEVLIERLSDKESKVTFNLLRQYLNLLWRIHDMLIQDITVKLVDQAVEAIFDCILNFGEDEVRGIDRKQVTKVVDKLKNMLRRAYHPNANRIDPAHDVSLERTDKFRLELGLKLLKIPLLAQRLQGLNDICSYCRNFIHRIVQFDTWIDSPYMLKWLLDNQVIEYIYKETSHEEIFRRSSEILHYLAQEHKLTPNHLDLIWAASLDKHESITHQVWSIIGQLSRVLDSTSIDYLFEKVKAFPLANYDFEFLKFLREITDRGIRIIAEKKRAQPKWYGMDLFWNASMDNSVASEIQNQAIQDFSWFIAWRLCRTQRLPVMERCITNLKESNSVPQSLLILRNTIASYSPANHSDDEYDPKTIISWLEANYSLLTHFFKHLEWYSNLVTKTKVPDGVSVDDHQFFRNYSHLRYLQSLIDFLEFALGQSDLTISQSQLDVFWSSTVTNAVSDRSREVAFKWLESARATSTVKPYSCVSDEVTTYIFEKKIPTLDFRTLTPFGFNFFEFYFRYINWSLKRFEQSQDEYKVLSFDLLGIESLWRVALEAENAQVGEGAVTILTRLQTSPGPELKAQAGAQHELHLARCLEYLKEASEALKAAEGGASSKRTLELKINRSLTLIRKFIDAFEGGDQEKHGASSRGDPIQFKIQVVSGSGFHLDMFTNETIGELKQKVADELRTTVDMLRFITNGKEIVDDAISLKRSVLVGGQIIHVAKRTVPAVTKGGHLTAGATSLSDEEKKWLPSTILSSDRYFEQFFKLLNLLSGPLCGQVWDILEKLPTNLRMKRTLKEIQGPSVNWDSLLDPQNIYRLYYSLQIVESLMQGSKDEPPEVQERWCRNFVEALGLSYLVHVIFLKVNFLDASTANNKRMQCLALVLKIINYFVLEQTPINAPTALPKFLKGYPDTLNVSPTDLIQKLIEVTLGASLPENITDTQLKETLPNDKIISTAMPMLVALAVQNVDALQVLLTQPSTPKWLDALVLSTPLAGSRDAFAMGIHQICWSYKTHESLPAGCNPTEFFLHQLIDLIPRFTFEENSKDNKYLHKCTEYFRLVNQLLHETIGKTDKLAPHFVKLLDNIIAMISSHPIIELSGSDPEDEILIGLLSLTCTLIGPDPEIKTKIGPSLVKEVFLHCLFEIPPIGFQGDFPPRCKTSASRTPAFAVLLELVRGCEANLTHLTNDLIEYHKKQPFKKQWLYLPQMYEKASCGYVGLKNLGCTCYMNSLVQQLFMHPQFRYGLLAVEDKSEDKSDSLLYQLQSIFANLQESAKKYFDPQGFTKAYKDEGHSMKVGEQMDVDEFCNKLFDKLETVLKGTPQEKILTRFFGGVVMNQIISKDCEHRSEREEGFCALPVVVKGKLKLCDALDLFVQGEMLDGDNKYHCDKCNAKVAALKRVCIGKLPNHLILNLKRIEFDFEQMKRIKVNQYCEFPQKINMEAYTAEGLARREQAEQNGGELPPPAHPLEFYDYELTGILVHMGTTESGHYYSYIRDSETKRWFHFNDMMVTPFDPVNIPDQCFGGTEITQVYDAFHRHNVRRTVPRVYNAYLLFYERCHPETLDVDNPIPKSQQSTVVPKELFDQVWDKNLKFLMDKVLFDKDYTQFVQDLMHLFDPEKCTHVGPLAEVSKFDTEAMPFDPLLRVIELGTRFFVQTLAHARDKECLPHLVKYLKSLYSQHVPSCQWLLHMLGNDPSWVYQMLFLCSVSSTQMEFAHLLVHVGSTLFPHEAALFLEDTPQAESTVAATAEPTRPKKKSKKDKEDGVYVPSAEPNLFIPSPGSSKSLIIRFLEAIIKMYPDLPTYWRNYSNFFYVLQEFALLGHPVRNAMMSRGFMQIFWHVYLGEESTLFQGKKSVVPKDSNKAKEKKKQEQIAIANMKHLIGAISALVRGSNIKRDVGVTAAAVSPVQLPGELCELSQTDLDVLLSKSFLLRALGDGECPETIGELSIHLGWENWENSKIIIDTICIGIHKEESERFPPFFTSLRMIMTMKDSQHDKRLEYTLNRFLSVVSDNIKYKHATLGAIKFFQEILPVSPKARDFMFNNMKEWVEKLLLYYSRDAPTKLADSLLTYESIRQNTEVIIMELVPELKGYIVTNVPLLAPTSAIADATVEQAEAAAGNAAEKAPVEISVALPEHASQRVGEIFRHLFSLIDPTLHEEYKKTAVVEQTIARTTEIWPTQYFKLQSYFRIMQWCIVSPDHQKIILEGNNLSTFLSLFELVDAMHIECDLNKHELIKFWEKVTRENREIISAFAESRQAQLRLFDCWISLKPSKTFFNYNNMSLPAFYQLLLRCARTSENFLTNMAKNPNFNWALRFLLIDSPEYSKPAVVLRELLDVCLNHSASFRKSMVTNIIDLGFPRKGVNGATVFEVLLRIIRDTPEQVEFCSIQGMQQLSEILRTQEHWDIPVLKPLLQSCYMAISWFTEPKLSDEMEALKNRLLQVKGPLKNLGFKACQFLPQITSDHIEIGTIIHSFISLLCACSVDLRHLFLGQLFEIQYQRAQKIGWVEENLWRRKHVTFIQQFCETSLKEDDNEMKRKAIKLMVMNGSEALALPSDVITSIVAVLDKVWESELRSILIQEPLFSDWVLKLTKHKYSELLDGDQVLFKFISKAFPHVAHHSLLLQDVVTDLETRLLACARADGESQEAEQQILVQELTLLYSVLGIVLQHEPTKNLFENNNRINLARIKESLATPGSLSLVPESTKTTLRQLVDKL